MRKIVLCLGCLTLALWTSPLLAGPAPAEPAAPATVGAPGPAAGDLALLLEPAGAPAPVPLACEHNFCSLQRESCAQFCGPCGYDLVCRNHTCESRCTCSLC